MADNMLQRGDFFAAMHKFSEFLSTVGVGVAWPVMFFIKRKQACLTGPRSGRSSMGNSSATGQAALKTLSPVAPPTFCRGRRASTRIAPSPGLNSNPLGAPFRSYRYRTANTRPPKEGCAGRERSIAPLCNYFPTGPDRARSGCWRRAWERMFDSNVLFVVHGETLQTQEKPRCQAEELALAGASARRQLHPP